MRWLVVRCEFKFVYVGLNKLLINDVWREELNEFLFTSGAVMRMPAEWEC
jgi:hypothetical protein